MKRDELAYHAAVMHYVGGETMNSIAQKLGVSRSTVSRLIGEAREQGLVQISLRPPEGTSSADARELTDRFGITPHVVTVPASANNMRSLTSVARVAGALVSDMMDDDVSIGVAWGNTLSAIGVQLLRKPVARASVVQLNGAANPTDFGVPYAGSIMADFASVFGCNPIHFPVPAFFDYTDTRDALWRESSVAKVLEKQRQCDIALFGIGSMEATMVSHVYTEDYFSDEELRALSAQGVVGDVCTVMLRADGTWQDLAINRRASGPTPDQLQSIPRRIAVVSEPSKAVATLAALRAGVVTDLVLSDRTAHELVLAARR